MLRLLETKGLSYSLALDNLLLFEYIIVLYNCLFTCDWRLFCTSSISARLGRVLIWIADERAFVVLKLHKLSKSILVQLIAVCFKSKLWDFAR